MVLTDWLPLEKVIQFWRLFDNFVLASIGGDNRKMQELWEAEMSSTTFASSDSLACGILIGQLKKKPLESCQKLSKRCQNQLTGKWIGWHCKKLHFLVFHDKRDLTLGHNRASIQESLQADNVLIFSRQETFSNIILSQ